MRARHVTTARGVDRGTLSMLAMHVIAFIFGHLDLIVCIRK
jgi:hypothetical protein